MYPKLPSFVYKLILVKVYLETNSGIMTTNDLMLFPHKKWLPFPGAMIFKVGGIFT